MDKSSFQGARGKKEYFEGWYFKQVTKDQKSILSLIPGVCYNEEDPHCFIQVIESTHQKSYYLRYNLEEFSVLEDGYVKIGNSTFTKTGIHLDIQRKELKLKGDIVFGDFHKFSPTLYAPTIMGPFSYLKKMECNHDIISFYHQLSGVVQLGKKKLDFTQGTGYIEKDFGSSFPKRYLWLESHHPTREEQATFFLSIADIPMPIHSFEGMIGSLVLPEKQYIFASYYGCKKIAETKKERGGEIILKQGQYTIVVEWEMDEGLTLKSPKSGTMAEHIKEDVSGSFDVVIYQKKRKMFQDHFTSAGIEYVR